jgi:hypothetical protein
MTIATQKATAASPSKTPLAKSVAVPKIVNVSRKDDTLDAKSPAQRTTKPLMKALLFIASNLLAVLTPKSTALA